MTEAPWKAELGPLGAFVRERRERAGLSLRDLADRTSVSNAYLSQVERGLHEPSLSLLKRIADALGVPLEALLARAGALPATRAEALDTERAIQEDPALSEPQRIALLSVYRSFVPAPPSVRSR